uniref:DUF2428 domain-containing protein n=1 Tax=Panagrellus redivivus TaxID=6233 RepID=A0A7E4V2L7_PANRE
MAETKSSTPLCLETDLTAGLEFLHKKPIPQWESPCCDEHDHFIVDHVLTGLLAEVNEKGQRPPTRLISVALALKRVAVVMNEMKWVYPRELADGMVLYLSRYIHDSIPIVCHNVIDSIEAFIQSKFENDEEEKRIVEALSERVLEKQTKFTIRATVLIMRYTDRELVGDHSWSTLYDKIGNSELTVALTDLIVFHGNKLASENKGLGVHFVEMRRILLNGTPESRRAVLTKVLPRMFKCVELRNVFNRDSAMLLNPYDEYYASADPLRVLEVVMSMAKFFVFDPTSTATAWSDLLEDTLLGEALICDDGEVSLLAWHLLCQNPRLTRPFGTDELAMAKIYLTSNMTEQNPGIRQRIVSEFRALMARMRESFKALKRVPLPEQMDLYKELVVSKLVPPSEADADKPANQVLLEGQIAFLKFMHGFLFDNLKAGANFNRRLLALHLVEVLHESDAAYKNGAADTMYSDLDMKSWLDHRCYDILRQLIDDEFEVIQMIAEKLLGSLQFAGDFASIETSVPLDVKNNYYKARCFWRDRKALGEESLLATMTHIQTLIEAECAAIEADPKYLGGDLRLTSLLVYVVGFFQMNVPFWSDASSIWSDYVPQTLVPLCLNVGRLVSPVLHNLAPEGFYPLESATLASNDEAIKGRYHKAQKLLVNCWRTHREVSTILSSLLACGMKSDPAKSLSPDGMLLLTPDVLQSTTAYLWLQLTECRHCGAFESSATCFNALCMVLWRLKDSRQLQYDYSKVDTPRDMLEKLIRSLHGQEASLGICETRRSAGLPPLILGILTTEPKSANHSALAYTMEKLLHGPKQALGMVIHTINCLVAIFDCTSLSETVKQYLSPAFQLCFQEPPSDPHPSYSNTHINFSDHWPIRNTLSRLFAALLRRMFGTPNKVQKSLFIPSRCTKAANEVFNVLPELYQMMLNLLKSFSGSNATPRAEIEIFPVLTMLAHVTPSTTADFPLSVFHPALIMVMVLAKGIHARQLAAVALITGTTEVELVKVIEVLGSLVPQYRYSSNVTEVFLNFSTLALERFAERDIPDEVNAALRELFDIIYETVIFEFLADLPLYRFFIAAKTLADENKLDDVIGRAFDMAQNWDFEERKWAAVGFADFLDSKQSLWSSEPENLPLQYRLDVYRVAKELDPALHARYYADFAAAETDSDFMAVVHPVLAAPEVLLDSSLLPIIENALDLPHLRGDTKAQLMELFTVLVAEEAPLSQDRFERIDTFTKTAAESFDDATRLRAAKVWLTTAEAFQHGAPPVSYEDAMTRAVPWLQDPDVAVRRAVGRKMNDYLLSTPLTLNSSILWSFAVAHDPSILAKIEQREIIATHETTFEPTILNPFAECFVVPGLEAVSRLIALIEQNKVDHREANDEE